MAQIIEQGDIFGKIGKGLGEGFGTGFGEQLQRNRVASAIESLQRKPPVEGVPQQPEKTMIEKLAALQRAGASPEFINMALPYLSSQQASEAAGILYPTKEEQAAKKLYPESVTPKPSYQGIDISSPSYLVPADESQIQRRALDIAKQTGLLFPQALAQAQKEDTSRLAKEQAFESRNELSRKQFDEQLALDTQKAGAEQFKDIIGEMKNEYYEKLQDRVMSGENPRKAAKELSKELLDFAKTRNILKTGTVLGFYKGSASAARNALNAARETYKKNEQLELFKNDLISNLGMSPEYASSVAYPIEKNSELAKAVKSAEKKTISAIGTKRFFPESYMKEIEEAIKPEDSILSIALALNDRRVNPEKFREKLTKDWKDGKVSLTERQVRELQTPIKNYNPNLHDLFYTSFWGKTHNL